LYYFRSSAQRLILEEFVKTKLYIYNPYPSVGGSETTLVRFLNSIDRNKYDISLLSLRNNINFFSKIKFIHLNSISTFFSFFKIRKIILNDTSKKIIFFSTQYFVNVWTIIFLNKIKNIKIFIYEINHPSELDYSFSFLEFLKKKIIKFLVIRFYKEANLISANSDELSRDLSKIVNKKVLTIYNPCFFKIHKIKKRIDRKIIRVLNISRFEMQKDHMTLLKGISNSKYKPRIQLNLVGFGSQKENIIKYASDNNINLRIYENAKNLEKFYINNDIFISTSLYEGLPTTMVEAASYCMPIISSNFKSGANEILQNGNAGHLFQVSDYIKLSEIIDNFIENKKIFYVKEKKCRKILSKFLNFKNIKKFNRCLDLLAK